MPTFHCAAYALVGLHGASLSIASSKKNTSLCRRNTEMAIVSSEDGSTPRSVNPGKPDVTWSDKNSCWNGKEGINHRDPSHSLLKLQEITSFSLWLPQGNYGPLKAQVFPAEIDRDASEQATSRPLSIYYNSAWYWGLEDTNKRNE